MHATAVIKRADNLSRQWIFLDNNSLVNYINKQVNYFEDYLDNFSETKLKEKELSSKFRYIY